MTTTPVETPVDSVKAEYRLGGDLICGYASKTGTRHPVNEDRCLFSPTDKKPNFFGVADGVGGGAHGEVASKVLLEHLSKAPRETYENPLKLSEWIQSADSIVLSAIANLTDQPGASTCVALWMLSDTHYHLSHVGDCRAYSLAPYYLGLGYKLRPLTIDQTYFHLGLIAPERGSPDDPARMVGVGVVGEPPIYRGKLRRQEFLVLCSDGLHKFLEESEMVNLVSSGIRANFDLSEICDHLVERAVKNGSYDDVSVMLLASENRQL